MAKDFIEHKEYVDFYNKGYQLHKASPELADLIVSVKTDSMRMHATKDGIYQAREDKLKEMQIEKELDYTPDWLKEDHFKENGSDMDLNKDPDLEPEID